MTQERAPIVHIRPVYLDKAGVCAFTSLSESTLEKEIREGRFPQPRMLASRRVAWLVQEIEAWAESRPVSDLPPPPNTSIKRRRQAEQPGAPACH